MRHTQPIKKIIAVVIFTTTMMIFAMPTYAVTIIPQCARDQSTQTADLNCALETFENIAQLILGITGSFALLMFVYGGFVFLSSGGSEEKVTKGKTVIRNAVIGIIIIMLSGYMVQYAVTTIKGKGSLQRAGSVCGKGENSAGKTVNKRTYVTEGGKEVCAAKCTDVPSYSCTTNTAYKNCLVGLCSGSQNRRCCPTN